MVAPVVCFCSSAHWLAAASIWRMLLMQALAWEVARAFTKFGIAMAARRPMMATTIMISTSVKPALRMFFIVFIVVIFLSCCGVNSATGGFIYYYRFVHLDCRTLPQRREYSTRNANKLP